MLNPNTQEATPQQILGMCVNRSDGLSPDQRLAKVTAATHSGHAVSMVQGNTLFLLYRPPGPVAVFEMFNGEQRPDQAASNVEAFLEAVKATGKEVAAVKDPTNEDAQVLQMAGGQSKHTPKGTIVAFRLGPQGGLSPANTVQANAPEA
jgi:hypothetical protein